MHGVPPAAYRSHASAVAAFAGASAATMTAVPATTVAVEIMATNSRRLRILFTRGFPSMSAAPCGAVLRSWWRSPVAGRDDVGLEGVLRRVGRVAGDHGALVERARALVGAAVRLAAVAAAAQHDRALLLHGAVAARQRTVPQRV